MGHFLYIERQNPGDANGNRSLLTSESYGREIYQLDFCGANVVQIDKKKNLNRLNDRMLRFWWSVPMGSRTPIVGTGIRNSIH